MARTRMQLTSPAFRYGELIPARYTCEADDVSPPLEWTHAPEGTASYVLLLEDIDAPDGNFTHWLLFDIPASASGLQERRPDLGIAGRNDDQQDGYGGPCPPPNHPQHRYCFRLYALDVESLEMEAGASRDRVMEAMEDHILAEAELVGRFERRPGRVR